MTGVLSDAWLIVVKEYREVLLRLGSLRANLLNLGLILFIFGVFMPLQAGRTWVTAWWLLFTWTWLPLFLVSAIVADSFAGERERHTLETLLASRMSDRAILLGKLAAAVLYGYGMLIVVMVVSLLTLNVSQRTFLHPLLFPTRVTLGVLVFGFLGTLLIGAVGVTVSLKAKTVRQAGQTLSLGMLAIFFIPLAVTGAVLGRLSPDVRDAAFVWVHDLDGRLAALVIALVLVALDSVFVGIALHRFKRNRLIFD